LIDVSQENKSHTAIFEAC